MINMKLTDIFQHYLMNTFFFLQVKLLHKIDKKHDNFFHQDLVKQYEISQVNNYKFELLEYENVH